MLDCNQKKRKNRRTAATFFRPKDHQRPRLRYLCLRVEVPWTAAANPLKFSGTLQSCKEPLAGLPSRDSASSSAGPEPSFSCVVHLVRQHSEGSWHAPTSLVRVLEASGLCGAAASVAAFSSSSPHRCSAPLALQLLGRPRKLRMVPKRPFQSRRCGLALSKQPCLLLAPNTTSEPINVAEIFKLGCAYTHI